MQNQKSKINNIFYFIRITNFLRGVENPKSRILKSFKKENALINPNSILNKDIYDSILTKMNPSRKESIEKTKTGIDSDTLNNFFTGVESRKRRPSEEIDKVSINTILNHLKFFKYWGIAQKVDWKIKKTLFTQPEQTYGQT